MLLGKRGKIFLVQFARPNVLIWDHKLCRTFKNYFGQFVWVETKATSIVAFHFMKRRLITCSSKLEQTLHVVHNMEFIRLYDFTKFYMGFKQQNSNY